MLGGMSTPFGFRMTCYSCERAEYDGFLIQRFRVARRRRQLRSRALVCLCARSNEGAVRFLTAVKLPLASGGNGADTRPCARFADGER
jgi:hypothetical protein